jgi:hypothetical protein
MYSVLQDFCEWLKKGEKASLDKNMSSKMDLKDEAILHTNQEQWLDKLWLYLFDGSAGGLISPIQIRREHRNRERVRQLEMEAILEAEQELNGIRQGNKMFNEQGNIIDIPCMDLLATHQIIENTAAEQSLDIGLDTPATMIRSVVKELSVRDLERSLNLRKIAILCESEILVSEIQPISMQSINADWMARWRESAESVFSPEMQVLWSKVLVHEIAQPGSFNLGLLSRLLQLSVDDLEVVRIASKYAFPDFIYFACGSYFNTDVHQGMFDIMEDLGLLFSSPVRKVLTSVTRSNFTFYLSCRGKALKVSHPDAAKCLVLSVLKFTRTGRQLMKLCENEVDLAYLFDLGHDLKKQGFSVAMGDLVGSGSKASFNEKMKL